MRILIHGLNFAPEPIGIGRFTGEMAAWLAARGHELRVVTAPPYYPAWRVADGYSGWRWRGESWRGVRVHRCPLYVPRRQGGLRRLVHLASFAASSTPVVSGQTAYWQPDLVFAIAPALIGAPSSWLAARLGGALAWLHIQDFEADAAFGLGLLPKWAHGAAASAECALLRGFDVVSAISPRMCERLVEKGVAAGRAVLFPNWADVSAIDPAVDGGACRRELGIPGDAVVALYAGNIGAKQGAETMAEAAAILHRERIAGAPDIRFVVCAQGAGVEVLRRAMAERGLDDHVMTLLPLQPEARLAELLCCADLHLLPQRAQAADLVMPSKLGGMLASGRPIVAAANADTQIAKVVAPCGLVVPPGDGAAMARAVARLAADAGLRRRLGAAARAAAIADWDRDAVLTRIEAELGRRIAEKKEREK